ncbi:MAG TPA: hypothetical protein VGM39_26505 [Kofleriaceae bacterium]
MRTRGLELAFVTKQAIELHGITIEGDRARRTVHVAGLASMLV